MYTQFYGLKEKPFSLLPDPDFLYFGEKHGSALDLLELAVLNQTGFCLLSGEIGAGKTTLIRELLNRLDENMEVGLVSNTHPSFGELLQWVMAAFGLQCESADQITLHKQFIEFVIQNYARGKRTLLIIDEAQNLSTSALEELRMLSNVNSGKDLVLQLILVGQQQLRDKLRQPNLEQFVQRIGVDFHLSALSEAETREYIDYRVCHAGGKTGLFSGSACDAIYRASGGVPRVINRICDLALVYAFSEQREVVEAAMVDAVIVDQQVGNVLEAARSCESTVRCAKIDVAERAADAAMESPDPAPVSGKTESETLPLQVSELVEPVAVTGVVISPDSDTLATAASSHDMAGKAIPDVRATASGVARHPDKMSELHRLVLDAEKQSAGNSGSGRDKRKVKFALALSVVLGGLVALAWLSRDIWSTWEPGELYRTAQARIQSLVVLPDIGSLRETSSIPVERITVDRIEPVQQTRSVAVVEPAPGDAGKLAPEVAEMSNQTAITVPDESTVKREQSAITETVEPPVSESAITDDAQRRELERLARLEEESRRLERERLAAERKFAEQLKERHALEQKAREERKRMLAAKAELERAAAERKRIEQAAIAPPRKVPSAEPSSRAGVESGPIDSQYGRIPVDEKHRATPIAQGAVPLEPQAEALPRSSSVTGFQGNPCDGPTARFMSTCGPQKP